MKKTTSTLLNGRVAEISVGYSLPIKHRDRIRITNSESSHRIFRHSWDIHKMELQETFKVMLLNTHNQVLGIVTIAEGGRASTQVDVRILLGVILKGAAVAVVFAHNHPSGNCTPSQSDYELHYKMYEQCKFFDISVLDHIILTKEQYYSFTEGRSYGI